MAAELFAAFEAVLAVLSLTAGVVGCAWMLTLAIDALLDLASRVLVLGAVAEFITRHRWSAPALRRWMDRR